MYNDILVYVDSRADLYTKEYNPQTNVLQDYAYLVYNPDKYQYIIDIYKIDYFLLDRNSLTAKYLIDDGVGKKFYSDDTSIIVEVIKDK